MQDDFYLSGREEERWIFWGARLEKAALWFYFFFYIKYISFSTVKNCVFHRTIFEPLRMYWDARGPCYVLRQRELSRAGIRVNRVCGSEFHLFEFPGKSAFCVCEAKLAIKFNKQFISRLEFISGFYFFSGCHTSRSNFKQKNAHNGVGAEFCNNGLKLMWTREFGATQKWFTSSDCRDKVPFLFFLATWQTWQRFLIPGIYESIANDGKKISV